MTPDLSPYVVFEGRARDALTFYAGVFGGEPLIETYGRHRASEDPLDQERVLYGVLRSPDGFVIRATDARTQESLTLGDNHFLCLNGDDDALLRRCWTGLCVGAVVVHPLETAPWGDAYGKLVDRFGVTWQVNIGDSE
ncbi:VOC family protein [Cellulomonas bogoriensis]|uniref:3-demethylubiquinone-9 3-methyltransferase n=1 Tax=Cellulomonas bogoriensis 69B4 = DSM 16987 TaxID=1386082 RepID=A0A0A0BZA3_9CELL|nr:VOC family protein [Cellulomonas bogoriensis]KGM13047.1 3-demethylubiquinone-9 3-methyltransferase [Cellulomonas bogoriensis 69B4 = DSM 16987]